MVAASPLFAARYALLIGCNDGGKEVDPLHWAESDATKFSALLNSIGGFDRTLETTLLAPDSAAVGAAIQVIHKKMKESLSPQGDLFLLYYSGHADGRDLLLKNSRFPLKDLQSALDSAPSGIKIGIFDACHSGAITAYKGGTRAEPFFLSHQPKIQGQVIIASTTPSQRAQESESLKGSIFSYYWMNGLRGSADISGDRRVTVDEAYRYAYRKTVEASLLSGGDPQSPMYRFNIHGQGDITLTDLTGRNGGIVFDRTCRGKFLVLSDSYADIFADFFKQTAHEWYVALDTGRYRIINADNGKVGLFTLALDRPGVTLRFNQSMLEPHEQVAIRSKGPELTAPKPADTPATRPLSMYTGGIGIGAIGTVGKVLEIPKVSIMLKSANILYVNDRCNVFIDVMYLTGGLNGGVILGTDVLTGPGTRRLYAGFGAGVFYFEKSSTDPLIPALAAHGGFLADLSGRMQMAIQVPYTVFIDRAVVSHCLGLEVKLLFAGKYRNIKVLMY
jgi:hypothetical protein